MSMEITDLNYDVLKHIVCLVAKSNDGAEDFVRLMSVCKVLNEFAEDKDVLKSVNFANVGLYPCQEVDFYQGNRLVLYSFHRADSILIKCACAGNENAQDLLAQVIIATASQILTETENISYEVRVLSAQFSVLFKEEVSTNPELQHLNDRAVLEKAHDNLRTIACSFLEQFVEGQDSKSAESCRSLYHYRVVRVFLTRCSPSEFIRMSRCLVRYFRYFNKRGDHLAFLNSVETFKKFLKDYVAYENMLKIRARFLEKTSCYIDAVSSDETGQVGDWERMIERLSPKIYQFNVEKYELDTNVGEIDYEGVQRKMDKKIAEHCAKVFKFLDNAFL